MGTKSQVSPHQQVSMQMFQLSVNTYNTCESSLVSSTRFHLIHFYCFIGFQDNIFTVVCHCKVNLSCLNLKESVKFTCNKRLSQQVFEGHIYMIRDHVSDFSELDFNRLSPGTLVHGPTSLFKNLVRKTYLRMAVYDFLFY